MSARATDYTNAAQQRLLQVVDLLAGHELNGLAPRAIALALAIADSSVTRDMDNLKTAGWAEKTPSGLWRLTPHVIQMSQRFAQAMHAGRQNWNDTHQRYAN